MSSCQKGASWFSYPGQDLFGEPWFRAPEGVDWKQEENICRAYSICTASQCLILSAPLPQLFIPICIYRITVYGHSRSSSAKEAETTRIMQHLLTAASQQQRTSDAPASEHPPLSCPLSSSLSSKANPPQQGNAAQLSCVSCGSHSTRWVLLVRMAFSPLGMPMLQAEFMEADKGGGVYLTPRAALYAQSILLLTLFGICCLQKSHHLQEGLQHTWRQGCADTWPALVCTSRSSQPTFHSEQASPRPQVLSPTAYCVVPHGDPGSCATSWHPHKPQRRKRGLHTNF